MSGKITTAGAAFKNCEKGRNSTINKKNKIKTSLINKSAIRVYCNHTASKFKRDFIMRRCS